MGFQTVKHELSNYLKWTTTGHIQLPDFQRGYKWDDERIRQLLVTILRGHPLGVVMLLKTGNDQIRFKPRAIEGVALADGVEADSLLLDGQQRLTSLTQALTGSGVVSTKDARGKLLDRRYFVHIETALKGEDFMDDAVRSVPGDGKERINFGKDVVLDLSTDDRQRAEGYFPLNLLYDPLNAALWLTKLPDTALMAQFMAEVVGPATAYDVPAIELDRETSKSAVATVFEKVNTGGLGLNVFELLTASFAGDKAYYDAHGQDFRLTDDWVATQRMFAPHPVLSVVENTDFVQGINLLTTLKRAKADTSGRPPAVSARKEDLLKLSLDDYLEWVDELRKAFLWSATFLADQFIFDAKFLPYPKQLVPLAAIKVVLGDDADLHGVRNRLSQWFWCGIMGELYGSAIETRFARDIEQVPSWAADLSDVTPRTVADCSFVASRLLSLRTRNAAAYKGVYALILSRGARDWMYDKALDKVQYAALAVDIHHIFPYAWCLKNGIEDAKRESIVNKTPLSATTNRAIGGSAPSEYVARIEKRAGISPGLLDDLVSTHLVDSTYLRKDDFSAFFSARLAQLTRIIEKATGKAVVNDLSDKPSESPAAFDPEDVAVVPDLDDVEDTTEDEGLDMVEAS